MRQTILETLVEIEKNKNIRILYACESGSRAWGFASPDSDYDVRFIFVKSKLNYLSINEPTDIIELQTNNLLDISGWELRKALRLFKKSNVTLYEWLQSPIVYRQNDDFADELRMLMPKYFSFRAGVLHYVGITKGAWKELQSEEVKIKKYFYCLQPIMAALWIIEKCEIPPMEFSKLIKIIDNNDINHEIDNLLEQKTASNEKKFIKPIPVLHNFISEKITFCENNLPETDAIRQDIDDLNKLFRKNLYDF